MTDREELLAADPVALTQRQMLMRLDARIDGFDKRLRKVENEQLTLRTERKTLLGVLGGAFLVWPVVTFLLVNVVHI